MASTDLASGGILARHQTRMPMEAPNDLREQARQAWLAQKDADNGCHTMAQTLLQAGVLTHADVFRKVRWSLDNGFPRAVNQSAQLLDGPSAQAVTRLLGQPQNFLMGDAAVAPAADTSQRAKRSSVADTVCQPWLTALVVPGVGAVAARP